MIDATVRKGLLLVLAGAAALGVSGCVPTRLLPSDYDQTAPATDGLTVVWEDSRNAATAGTDVYLYDTETSTQSWSPEGTANRVEPAISNGYIVWIDNGRLRAKNRSTGQVFNVTSGGATQSDPALCGSVVTWTDTRSGSDVYARDLAGGSEIAVAATSAVEAYPACDAGRIVYMRSASNEWATIRMYDLASQQTTVVSSKPFNQWRPAISGDRVVWQAWPNQPDTTEGIQIRGTNLSTGVDFTVSDGPGNQTAPVISGPVVAWEDARDGDPRMWWRDLTATKGEQPVTTEDVIGAQQAPALIQQGARLPEQPHGGLEHLSNTAAQSVIRPSVASL